MYKKSKVLFITFFIIFTIFISLFIYLENNKYTRQTIQNKQLFTSIVGLPDLAISTEANYIRHRSLTNINDIFIDGAEHIEYFPTTYTISYGYKNEK